MTSYRQEVFNVLLVQLLQEKGVISAPESILRLGDPQARRMPDVLVEYNGLRLMIEGEVADQPDAAAKAEASASSRVEEGLAHIGIAVVHPGALRQIEFGKLKAALAASQLQINVITEAERTGFFEGDVERLRDALTSAFDALLREDVVAQAVAIIDLAVETYAATICNYRGPRERLAEMLGVRPLEGQVVDLGWKEPQEVFSLEQVTAAVRVSGLILLNAIISHEVLAQHHRKIAGIKTLTVNASPVDFFVEQWRRIVEKIDYYPIFHLAIEIIINVGNMPSIYVGVRRLVQAAQDVIQLRVALKHDLMGRIYHRLLSEAKYLGTYYTSIPAATLLLKLALRPAAGQTNWHNLKQVRQLRIADPACGTGTLLMAAADAVTDNYFRANAAEGHPARTNEIHKALAEEILHGYDVLPSAIHLTASTLALKAPDVPFDKMNLFSLPLGGPHHRLGSLEFLAGRQQSIQMDLFGSTAGAQQTTGDGDDQLLSAPLPDLDLCVMNPPFTRSVGGNLLFGSVPDEEREPMQKKLQKLIQEQKAQASVTAGLGSVFIAIADRYVKSGGRIALILPKALLSGVSWEPSRNLINQGYRIEYLIASQDPERWNFSESTDLSEVMMIMQKSDPDSPAPDRPAVAINLWRNPNTTFEALSVASEVLRNGVPDLFEGQGGFEIMLGDQKLGEAIAISQEELKAQPSWLLPCAFAQADLTRAAYHLGQHSLRLPGQRKGKRLPLCPLGDLGTLGPDRRDIHDGFKLSHNNAVTAYPTIWGHDTANIFTLEQKPNSYLSPLPKAKAGRNLRRVEDLWPLAGRLLIAERFWLKKQNLVAVRSSEPVLSNVWWTFSLNKKTAAQRAEKVLALWLNSTLGLISILASREETRGAWSGIKKPSLAALPVLKVNELSAEQIKALTAAYDKLAGQSLRPLPEMADDPARAEIDKAIAKALNLPDFSILRALLAKEPVVCLKPL
jgi:hypothetical protein